MRRWTALARICAATALLVLLAGAGARADEPNFPAFTGYVVDDAGILSTATRHQLSEALGEFQRATKRQVVVATVKNLQGLPIEDYGYRLGRAWGVGQRGQDTGAILLVAPNERQVRIEVGYGLEGELTDARSKQIIEQVILPAFRTGDYDRGVVAGTAAILRVLGAPTGTGTTLGPRGAPQAGVTGSRPGDLWGFLLPLLIFGIFAFLRSHSYGRRGAYMAPIIWGRGFGGGGFGSGGGFGGGFGGGGWRLVRRRRRLGTVVMNAALTDADKRRVETAIAALEARTSAELAVVIARRSHDYAAYPFLWATALALFAGGALAVLFPRALPIEVILVQGIAFTVVYLILHFTPLGITLTPARVKLINARRLAAAEFASAVAQRTQNRAGLLLFVSLTERHVEILVDRSIDDQIARERWPEIVARFQSAAGGSLADRLIAAIDACAAALERDFPASGQQVNEIPDAVKEI